MFQILEPSTLFEALVHHFPDVKKNTIREWLMAARIRVDNGIVKKGNLPLVPGQWVAIGSKTHLGEGGLVILYEDKDLVVIEKPVGLLSVATDFKEEVTAHALVKKRRQRVYPVHRLDRDVSGVMVFAYSERAKEGLKGQFFLHSARREYITLVEGTPSSDEGTWRSFLVEDEAYFVKSSKKGQEAVTRFKVLKKMKNSTLLTIHLETGRKNQIRVHSSEAGHPIVGDRKYGSKTNPFKRICLHAKRLSFVHPVLQKEMRFTSHSTESWMCDAE